MFMKEIYIKQLFPEIDVNSERNSDTVWYDYFFYLGL